MTFLQNLYDADPETAQIIQTVLKQKSHDISSELIDILINETLWGLSEELSFGRAIAKGLGNLISEIPSLKKQDAVKTYCRLIRKAGQNGPTLGRIMATHLVPVLKYGNNGFLETFLNTIDVMLSKGSYTLTAPLDILYSLLDAGDIASCRSYLDLLKDIYLQELSYNQSLRLTHTLPNAVQGFPASRRKYQIEQLQRVVRADFRLADSFLDGMAKGLNLLSEDALSRFVTLSLKKYDQNRDLGESFFSLEAQNARDIADDMQVTVSLAQAMPQLNRYLRARTGFPLSVSPLSFLGKQEHEIFSDGKFIFLPDEISMFKNKEENLRLYKCLVRLEACYYEFNTFDFDLEKVSTLNIQNPILNTQNSTFENDFERFFSLFPIKSLAVDLFTIFEHYRIRKMLRSSYPGLSKQVFPMLQTEALNIAASDVNAGSLFELYELISLGIDIPIQQSLIEIKKAVKEKIAQNNSVEICAELVFIAYPKITAMMNIGSENDYVPLKMPFGRRFKPDSFFSTWGNAEQIASAVKIRLEEKGLNAYKSDIRRHIIEHGNLTNEDIKELIIFHNRHFQPSLEKDANNKVDLSWIDLSEFFRSTNDAAQSDSENGSVFRYKEWDCRLNDYLYNHVRVLDQYLIGTISDFYQQTLNRYRGIVRRIRHAFELLKPEGLIILRQWIEGDAFDYRALLDYAVDKKAGITPSERLYIKRIKQQRDVAMLLLVDMSKSTANTVFGSSSTVMELEKEAIVLFCEALDIVGDAYAIAGFSGTGRLGVDYFRIKDFDEPSTGEVQSRINAMSPRHSTRMGAAIRHAAAQLVQIPAKVHLLIILSDGFPNDADYKREYAIADTRKAIAEARAKTIYTRAITVSLSNDPQLDELYGSLHHNLITDVRDLPDRLLRILIRIF